MANSGSSQSLIDPLVESVSNSLPYLKGRMDIVAKDELIESNRKCLISMSKYSLSGVIQTFAIQLQQTVQMESAEHDVERAKRSQRIILEIMNECLEAQVETRKLNDHLLDFVVKRIYELCRSKTEWPDNDDIVCMARRLLYLLSQSNFDVMYRPIAIPLSLLPKFNDDKPDLETLSLLPSLAFTADRIRMFLSAVTAVVREAKKNYQVAIAQLICEVIDSWMKRDSQGYIELQMGNNDLSNDCLVLFEHFFTLSEKNSKHKQSCWPLLMRMLLICPNTLLRAFGGEDHADGGHPNVVVFIDAVRKAIGSAKPPLCDVAVQVSVVVCEAASLLPKESKQSGVRGLVPKFESDMKERLFGSGRVLSDAPTPSEDQLLVSALTALYRLNRFPVYKEFMSKFIDESDGTVPTRFRIATIRALLALHSVTSTKSDESLQDETSVATAFPKLAAQVRSLFAKVVNQVQVHPGHASSSTAGHQAKMTKKESKLQLSYDTNLSLLYHLLELFHADCNFALVHAEGDSSDHCRDMQALMEHLCTCLQDQKFRQVAPMASKTLLKLHRPEHIKQWSPDDISAGFWTITSHVIVSLAMQLTSIRQTPEKNLLELLHDLLASRNHFIFKEKPRQRVSDVFSPSRTKLEVVFLASLCSPNNEVIKLAAKCLMLLCEEVDLLADIEESFVVEMSPNLGVLRQLATAGELKTGSRAQQKQILALLRQIQTPTPGTKSAWDHMHSRWSPLIAKALFEAGDVRFDDVPSSTGTTAHPPPAPQSATAPSQGATSDAEAEVQLPAELPGITFFLASLGGVCVLQDPNRPASPSMSGEDKPQSALTRNLDRFMEKLVDLLVCDLPSVGMQVREMAKEALAVEINPHLVPRLFELLLKRITGITSSGRGIIVSSANTLLVEQCVTVVRLLLESSRDDIDPFLPFADIEPLLQGCIDYLRQETTTAATCRVKINLCRLLVAVMTRREVLTFRHEMRFRNRVVEQLMHFVSAGSEGESVSDSSVVANDLVELDVACVEAMASLLKDLPLQPQQDDETDPVEAKSNLFLKSFTFLMNITNRGHSDSQQTGRIAMSPILRRREGSQAAALTTEQASSRAGTAALMTVRSGTVNSYRPSMHSTRAMTARMTMTPSTSPVRTLSNRARNTFGTRAGPENGSDAESPLRGRPKRRSLVVRDFRSRGDSVDDVASASERGSTNDVSDRVGPGAGAPKLAGPAKSYQRELLRSQWEKLREFSTACMSHLLSANVEVGLSHAISMGYHPDVGVRLAFLQVLTKVLKQGTEFENLAETVLSDRYAKLLSLVCEPNLFLVRGLSESCTTDQLDELAPALMTVFEARDSLFPLCQRLAEHEVDQCRSASTLLRRNSLASKVLAATTNNYGREYLNRVLAPLFETLLTDQDRSYEIDPSRLEADQDLEQNQENLHELALDLVQAVEDSVATVPHPLRLLCYGLRAATERKFPDIALSTVGALFYLRFLSPAIVVPRTQELTNSGRAMRALLLLSKVIQVAANQTTFGKEGYMTPMNKTVAEISPRINAVLDTISQAVLISPKLRSKMHYYGALVPPESSADGGARSASVSSHLDVPSNGLLGPRAGSDVSSSTDEGESNSIAGIAESDIQTLHRVLAENVDKLDRELTLLNSAAKRRQATSAASGSGTSRLPSEVLDALSKLMAQLGDPVKPDNQTLGRRSTLAWSSQSASKLEEFLEIHRRLGTSREEIENRHMFYVTGKSKMGRPVVYIIARRYTSDLDGDQVVYHVLHTLKPFMGQQIDLVVDLTLFGRENEPDENVINKLVSYLPTTASEHIGSIYAFNPSTAFAAFAKRLQKRFKLGKKVHFVSLSQLKEKIREPALPAATLRMCDYTTNFDKASRIGTHRKELPVNISIGSSSFALRYNDRVHLFGQPTRCIDVYTVAGLEEVSEKPDGLLQINHNGKDLMQLSSPHSEEISRLIRDAWARHLLSEPESKKRWKVMRPGDVPGTLLNVALLNLGSPEPTLRLASYNLLSAVTTTFDFDIGGRLMEASGLSIPENNSSFIVSISAALAQSELGMTLEFLDECIQGLYTSTLEQKQLCLEYMQPWLPNIHLEKNPDKVRHLVRGLLDITLSEPELYNSIRDKLWYAFASIEHLVDGVVDEFIQAALAAGSGSTECKILADALVTLSSANCQRVSRIVVDNTLELLRLASQKSQDSLEKHHTWPSILVLAKFLLYLSFNNRLDVVNNAPKVFHIVCMLAGLGSNRFRAGMHSIALNVTHSLCTSLPLKSEALALLRLHLQEMNQPNFLLQFGITGVPRTNNDFLGRSPSLSPRMSALHAPLATGGTLPQRGRLRMTSIGAIASRLWEILQLCHQTSTNDVRVDVSVWQRLAASTAYRREPSLQPRGFVVLGVITETPSEDVLKKVVRTLQAALARYDVELIDSILLCLSHLMKYIPPSGLHYHTTMFWVSLLLLQINEPSIFDSALGVLATLLQTMEAESLLREGVESAFRGTRSAALKSIQALEKESKISFDNNFSFAVATLLLKGLSHPLARSIEQTQNVLMRLIAIEQKCHGNLSRPLLGYLTAMLPNSTELQLLVEQSSADGHFSALFDDSMIGSSLEAALMVAMLCSRLGVTQHAQERRFLFQLLAHAAKAQPAAFQPVSSLLIPLIRKEMSRLADEETVRSSQLVISLLMSYQAEMSAREDSGGSEFDDDHVAAGSKLLSEHNFQGVLKCAEFSEQADQSKVHSSKLVADVLEQLLVETPSTPGVGPWQPRSLSISLSRTPSVNLSAGSLSEEDVDADSFA